MTDIIQRYFTLESSQTNRRKNNKIYLRRSLYQSMHKPEDGAATSSWNRDGKEAMSHVGAQKILILVNLSIRKQSDSKKRQ